MIGPENKKQKETNRVNCVCVCVCFLESVTPLKNGSLIYPSNGPLIWRKKTGHEKRFLVDRAFVRCLMGWSPHREK